MSTKKSYEDFEIIDIQFVVSKFGTQRFDFIFAVCIRLFEKFFSVKEIPLFCNLLNIKHNSKGLYGSGELNLFDF